MSKLKKTVEKLFPALFWILLMMAFDTLAGTILTLICAIIHECGHYVMLLLIKKRDVDLPRATFLGLKIDASGVLSYRQELLLCLGGPLANIIAFCLLIPFFALDAYFFIFALLNLFTAISNLLPIRGYDGYRILSSLLLDRAEADTAERIMGAFSAIFCALLVLISLILMMKIGEGYWIFAIFFAVLLKEILKSH